MKSELNGQEQRKTVLAGRDAQILELAARGIGDMLVADRQLFCDIYNRSDSGMRREGLSPRYTMMTLLGLHRYQRSGRTSPVATGPVLEALLRDVRWIDTTGDLGLLLWTCAELAPDNLPEIYENVRAKDALQRFADGRRASTMEVAWYLTGLTTCKLAGHADLPGMSEQILAARRILEDSCGPSGVYGHLGRRASSRGYLRGRIGSFADQVYPTIAFARLARANCDTSARDMALRTAEKMCALQGPQGEWFWQFDSPSGRVVSRYPVYSVHQHAMGPMMLLETAAASGQSFDSAISRGLAWIHGKNELGVDLVEPSLGLIWRCIHLSAAGAYLDAASRILRLHNGKVHPRRLKIRYECRPYELGWLLYAFA